MYRAQYSRKENGIRTGFIYRIIITGALMNCSF